MHNGTPGALAALLCGQRCSAGLAAAAAVQRAEPRLDRLAERIERALEVVVAVRVGDRRWDLHLQSKIVVRLPEDEVGAALHRLSVLITQEKILDRDIAAVDLRVPDRLIIEPAATTKPTGASKL